MKYILVIDQGTTGSSVSLVDSQGELVFSVDAEFPSSYPKQGWVEQNLEDIWVSVKTSMKKVLEKSQVCSSQIQAIGITNQRETVGAWDHEGQGLYPAIVWQCRRTAQRCQELGSFKSYIKKKTGLVTDPYFSATKMEWLLQKVKKVQRAAKNKTLHLGTMDSYLIYKLTQGQSFVTDVSNASRTSLFDIHKLRWDPKLLQIFGVKEDFLPKVQASGGFFGVTSRVEGLPDGIPISAVLGDQQSALFGQLALKAGESKVTFGTGSFILLNTGHEMIDSKKGLLTTVAWQLSEKHRPVYALEGGAFVCGAAVQWLRDGLEIITHSSEVETLAHEVDDTRGVEFVPALTGLGSPYWDPEARGLLLGLTRGVTKAHIARATLEAMALQNVSILEAMQKDLKKNLKTIRVDGGASANHLLMQMQADFLGTPVEKPQQIETTTMGVAFLAGLSVGLWKNLDTLKKQWQLDKILKPQISKKQRQQRLQSWESAVSYARLIGTRK
jgi:glycerol kinase